MLSKLHHYLQKTEAAIAAGSLGLLLLLSLSQILLRNILEFSYPEIDIINRNLLVICGLMGAVLATAKHTHIKTDAINVLLSKKIKSRLQLPLALFASLICIALSYYSSIFVLDEWEYMPINERWTLPFTLVYPISFALMGVHFVLNEILREK